MVHRVIHRRAAEELAKALPLMVDRAANQPVDVLEVAEHRALRHAGSFRDEGNAGTEVPVLVEREQRLDHGVATACRALVATVDDGGVERRGVEDVVG